MIYMWNLKRKVRLIETESRKLAARGWGVGKIWRSWKRAQTFSYKINSLRISCMTKKVYSY